MKKTIIVIVFLCIFFIIFILLSNKKIPLISNDNELKMEIPTTVEKIVVKDDLEDKIIKTIDDSMEVKKILTILSKNNKETGRVTSEGNNWTLFMYNEKNVLINNILVWKTGHIGLENKEYKLSFNDATQLLKLLST